MPYASAPCLALAFAMTCIAGCATTTQASAACQAPMPATGAAFSGPVLQVIDGARLCVAVGPAPTDWIAVRLPGLPEAGLSRSAARALLMATTFSRRLDCIAERTEAGAVLAVCTVEGAALGEQMRGARSRPEWRSWR